MHAASKHLSYIHKLGGFTLQKLQIMKSDPSSCQWGGGVIPGVGNDNNNYNSAWLTTAGSIRSRLPSLELPILENLGELLFSGGPQPGCKVHVLTQLGALLHLAVIQVCP